MIGIPCPLENYQPTASWCSHAQGCRLEVIVPLEGERYCTAAETEDFDMIPKLFLRQSQNRRRKEHRFIIGVCNEEADAFAAKGGERGSCDMCSVEP